MSGDNHTTYLSARTHAHWSVYRQTNGSSHVMNDVILPRKATNPTDVIFVYLNRTATCPCTNFRRWMEETGTERPLKHNTRPETDPMHEQHDKKSIYSTSTCNTHKRYVRYNKCTRRTFRTLCTVSYF